MTQQIANLAGTASGQKLTRVIDILNWSANHLREKDIESPRLTVEILLSHVLGVKRIDLYLNYDRPLSEPERDQFRALLKRRLTREPVQYITGRAGFMDLMFEVDTRVLIPRPETEILVETTVEYCKTAFGDGPVRILDIGTGSGNIACCIAASLGNADVTALDVRAEILELAQRNADRNGLESRIRFVQGDIFEPDTFPPESFDVIVSNPPYVALKDFGGLMPEVRDFEPAHALHDGDDGFSCYRQIAQSSGLLLDPASSKRATFLEIGAGMSGPVKQLFADSGCSHVRIIKDLAGIERIVQATAAGTEL